MLLFTIGNTFGQSVTDKAQLYLKQNEFNRAKNLLKDQVDKNK